MKISLSLNLYGGISIRYIILCAQYNINFFFSLYRICWKCGVSSVCERMFGMHFASIHLDSSVLQCLYCPKEFNHEDNNAFEQHYGEHLRQKEERR